MLRAVIMTYFKQQELCSLTKFKTQCWTTEPQHAYTRKSVCLVCFWIAHA